MLTSTIAPPARGTVMWRPIATLTAQAANNPAPAMTRPAGIGDKQPCYVVVTAPTAGFSLGAAGATAASAFVVGIGESWMAGPILGQDITEWGLFAAAPVADAIIDFLSARLSVDARTAPISVHEPPASQPVLDFVWRQLV